tara:strand:- start:1552 stop:2010 length:459 start_codon:yes stop_codon:yes gene_type:complete
MSKFNTKLWNLGHKIENEIKPHLDEFLGCSFERSDDIFDVLDFHDNENKKIVEVKGRTSASSAWRDTIITCGKITEGLMKIEQGWELYYFFVFTDKTMYFKLDPNNCDFNMKYTGTNHIPHYMIPIEFLTEFERVDTNNDLEPEPEPENNLV